VTDLEDELRRILRDDRLDVPLRPDAVSSLIGNARRRRHYRVALSAVGAAIAGTVLAGTAYAVVNNEIDQPVSPPVAPVSSTPWPGRPGIPGQPPTDTSGPQRSRTMPDGRPTKTREDNGSSRQRPTTSRSPDNPSGSNGGGPGSNDGGPGSNDGGPGSNDGGPVSTGGSPPSTDGSAKASSTQGPPSR
jgi:hypothetical protein